jgi:hypothetical protein
MNHIMPMRKERSTAALYMPPSFSPITVPNQNTNISTNSTKPGINAQAGSQSFNVATAPNISVNSETDPKIGHGLLWGT